MISTVFALAGEAEGSYPQAASLRGAAARHGDNSLPPEPKPLPFSVSRLTGLERLNGSIFRLPRSSLPRQCRGHLSATFLLTCLRLVPAYDSTTPEGKSCSACSP